jgi:hypothetical protein
MCSFHVCVYSFSAVLEQKLSEATHYRPWPRLAGLIVPVMELFTLPTSIPDGRWEAARPEDVVVSHPINNVVIAKQAIIEKKRFI